jgi:CRP/FNR family transcriptional regulator
MNKSEILQLFPFFTESDPASQEEMLTYGRHAKLEPGSFYLRERDNCSQIAMVGNGLLRVYKVGESGREITLYYVKPGQTCLLNISCLMSGMACPATAVVEESVEAVVFSGDLFRKWVANHAGVRNFVFDILSTRVAHIMALVEEVAFRKMDQRLADYLYARFMSTGASVTEIPVTHEKIASDLGSAREVVSRLLKDFERERAVRLARGKIYLDQADVLRSIAGVTPRGSQVQL